MIINHNMYKSACPYLEIKSADFVTFYRQKDWTLWDLNRRVATSEVVVKTGRAEEIIRKRRAKATWRDRTGVL